MSSVSSAIGQMIHCILPLYRWRYRLSMDTIPGGLWIDSVLMPCASARAIVSWIFSSVL